MSKKPPPRDQGDSRNEYIPAYISKAPFYAEGLSDGDYLEHQRLHATPKDTLDKAKWYDRGRKAGPAATKYRKGACENCGAMSHKTKDCLEKPRKHGAKWTGKNIQADEIVADVKLGWDAKRDRWNGYDAREYTAVVQEFEDMEKLRQSAASTSNPKNKGTDSDDDDDPDSTDKADAKYAEETDMGRSQPTSTRQLRLREDTAKYLLDLNPESARYDPKTRSMDTTAQTLSNNPADSIAEEGFVRPAASSGDAAAFERAQKYAWETQEATNKSNANAKTKMLHLQANPTEGEILLKRRTEESTAKKASQRKALIDKYGEQAHLQTQDQDQDQSNPATASSSNGGISNKSRPRAVMASESYTEYDKHGNPKLAPGQSRANARSKYPEDIRTNNHTSVFGSWWKDFQWGYACCHSTVKNSYCTGDEGRRAFEEAQGLRTGQGLLSLTQDGDLNTGDESERVEATDPDAKSISNSKLDRVDRDQADRLRNEQEGEDIQYRKDEVNADTEQVLGVRDRRGNKRNFENVDSAVTEEELEAYKRNKTAANDPMRTWGDLGANGLLETSK